MRTLLCAAAFALAAALPAATAVRAQPAAPLIRIGAGPDDPGLALVYAQQAGLYAKAGLNVEVTKMRGAAAVAAALAGGSLEIGKGATLSVLTAIAKGLPFTIIGNISMYNADRPDIALIVLASSAIQTPKDLVGKVLADVSLTDENSVATFAWLDQHGIDSTAMKFVEIPASASLAAMEQGRVAGSTLYEPMWTAAMATGKARVLGYPYDAIGKHFSSAVLFAETKWAQDHRDLIVRFLRVVQDASVYMSAHENDTIQLSAEFGGVDPSLIAKMHRAERTVPIEPSDIQPVIDTAVKYKIIPKALNAADLICSCAMRRTK